MIFFIPVGIAYAQEAAPPPGAALFSSFTLMIILFAIFYFLIIRPQQKKAKEHKEMLSKLTKGDNVITSGGLHGRITSVGEETVTMEISENVRVKVNKEAIVSRKPQG